MASQDRRAVRDDALQQQPGEQLTVRGQRTGGNDGEASDQLSSEKSSAEQGGSKRSGKMQQGKVGGGQVR